MSEPRIRKPVRSSRNAAPANVTNTPQRNWRAPLRPATWRAWLARNHPTTRTGWALLALWIVLIVSLITFISSYYIAPFGEYPLLSYFPVGLIGLAMWLVGLIQLARADLKAPLWGYDVATPSYAGYGTILAGTFEFAVLLTLVLSWQYVDIYIGGIVVVIAYLVVASLIGRALDWYAHRRAQAAESGTATTVAEPAPRISRRTLLVGAGVIGAEAVGIGWLISALPSLVPLQMFPAARGGDGSFIAWAPDSRRLATNVGEGVIQIWDATTGAALQRLDTHANDFTGVAWASDGQRLAIGQSRNICTPIPNGLGCSEADSIVVWDVATERPLITHAGDFQGLRLIIWRPQRDELLFVDGKGIHIWNARSGKDERVISVSANANVNALAWSPDGNYLTGEVNDQFIVWDATTTKQIGAYANDGRMDNFIFPSLAWSPDGARLAAGDNANKLRTWDALTGANVFTYAGPIAPGTTYPDLITVNAIAWSPDSRYVAAASNDTTVRIWRASAEGQRQPTFVWKGHMSSVQAVAWSPDGKYVASGNGEGVVQVWRPQGDLWG